MGELAALLASVTWAYASILWTRLGATTAPMPLNFVKTALAALILAGAMPLFGAGFEGTGRDLLLLAASGLLGLTIGDTVYFHALQHIGPRRTLLLWTLTPFLSALMAWPWLGEPLTWKLFGSMAVTVAGVVLVVGDRGVVSPVQGSLAKGLAFAMVAVSMQSISNVVVKFAGEDVGALTSSVLRLAAGTGGLFFQLALLRRLPEVMTPLRDRRSITAVLLATVTGTVFGIWLSVYGLLHASQVAVAATLNGLAPVFVLPMSWVMLGERFGPRGVVGALVAVAGVAWMSI